jgi:cytochrome P450
MLPWSTLQILAFLIILITVWVRKRKQRQRILRYNGIPGPEPSFLLGNLVPLVEANVTAVDEWIKKYGKTIGIFDGRPVIFTADAELARQIQTKDFALFPNRRTLLPEGGFDANPDHEQSLIATSVPPHRWKEQRALIAPAFSSSKIRASVSLVSEGIDGLMDDIRKVEHEPDFDIYDLFQRLTMDTIGRSAFGTRLDVQQNPNNEFFVATRRVFDNPLKSWSLVLTFVSMTFPEFFYILYPIRKFARVFQCWIGRPNHFSYQTQMCVRITEKRKQQSLRGEQTPDDMLQRLIDANLTSEELKDIMETGLEANNDADDSKSKGQKRHGKVHRMTNEEIAANAGLMFDAGYETTSTFLGFLFHVFVNKQEIQDGVRNEIMQLKEQDGVLDTNVIQALPYMTSVMYECLRYYPPVTFFVSRQSTAEYKYKNISIPADVAIQVVVPAMHHDPEYWPQPEVFDPLRFYGENKSRAQSPAFQAFGAGPRNCLGMRFAMMEAKLVVARVLSEYKLIPGPRTEAFDKLELEYKPITQNPKNGVFVKAVRV